MLHRFLRCGRTIVWFGRLVAKQIHVRRQIALHMGTQWVREQMPLPASQEMVKATMGVLRTAWQPSIQRQAAQRSQRLRKILTRLELLNRPAYSLTTPASQRVYYAALLKCVNAICDTPISQDALRLIRGPLADSPTGLGHYLARWLREKFASLPEVWVDTLPTGNQTASARGAVPLSPVQQSLVLNRSDAKRSNIARARKQHRQSIQANAAIVADQELTCIMAEREFQMLALPSAVLDACRRRQH
ncbi:MAG: hypothetical protein KDB03_18475 [Planctomycetales bacterium]|nr:hypothetical protein [Planctomycetales bacterium]